MTLVFLDTVGLITDEDQSDQWREAWRETLFLNGEWRWVTGRARRKRVTMEGVTNQDGAADPPPLPNGWVWVKLHEVGEVKLGRQRSPEHHYGPYMRPNLRVAKDYEDQSDLSDALEMNFTLQEYEAYRLKRGDVRLNEGQSLEWIGQPAMYRDELPPVCLSNPSCESSEGAATDGHG